MRIIKWHVDHDTNHHDRHASRDIVNSAKPPRQVNATDIASLTLASTEVPRHLQTLTGWFDHPGSHQKCLQLSHRLPRQDELPPASPV